MTEAEMLQDLAAADAAGDADLANHIAGRIRSLRKLSGDLSSSLEAPGNKEAVVASARNVPASFLTDDEATNRRMAEAAWDQGAKRALTKADAFRAGAVGLGTAASFIPGVAPAMASGGLLSGGLSDEDTLRGVAADAGQGALFAGALAKFLPLAWNAFARRAGPLAEGSAVRATNADRTAVRKAFKGSDEARQRLGRFLLDEDIRLRSPQTIREGAQAIINEAGPQIGSLAKNADKAGATFDLALARANALQAQKVATLSQNTEQAALYQRVVNFLDDQIARHGQNVPPSVAHNIRQQVDSLAAWDQATPKALTQAWRATRGAIDDELARAMEQAGQGDQWAQANSRFAKAKTAEKLAKIGAERRLGNRLGSPSEKASAIAGGVVAATGNPVSGLALPAATYALNRYSMPVWARTLDAVGRTARPAGATLDPAKVSLLNLLRPRFDVEALIPALAEDGPTDPSNGRGR